jgi:RHS repeat-associated protein
VDLFLGQEILENADLVLPGRMPAVIHRTCNPLDPFGAIAGFELGLGPGWALSVEVVLQAETPFVRRLVLPGNARFGFGLWIDGTFVNTTDRQFAGAVLTAETGGRHTLRLKDGRQWHFVPSARIPGLSLLAEQTDRNGNSLIIEHDVNDRIARLIEPGGRELVLTYTNNRLTEVHDPLGRTVRYGYDSNRRLETVTDPAGGVTRYTYDTSGKILTITNARGIVHPRNQIGSGVDLRGDVLLEGRVVRQEQADGGVWKFEYLVRHFPCLSAAGSGPGGGGSGCGSLTLHIGTRVTDPRGHSTVHLLTDDGLVRESKDVLGQQTRFERDARGQVVAIHDPLNRKTRFEYDAAGNVTQITDPEGNIRRFEYEPTFDRLTRFTNPLGNITTFTYDARGNLTSITDPLGQVTQIAYNAFGQPSSITDPLGNVTTFTYDAHGNLAAITDPLGNTTERIYDEVSRLIAQTDPRGRTSHFTYDALNRIAEIVDALNGVTSFTYDANGNLLTLTDALGHTTTYEYDNMDRLIRRTDPVGASESFAYDTMGNLIRHTDRKGQETTFDYDALSRRTKACYADGTTTTFVYDAVGRLVHASDTAGGDILHTYDVLDRLIQQTTGLGTVEYTYDALGRRTSMHVSGQAPVTYRYDNNSRLTQLTQGAQVVDFAYDALGRRTRLTLPNGVATEYSYDAASRLTEMIYRNATGVLGNLTYQYDAAGHRTHMGGSFARTLLPEPVAAASYDAVNRQLTFGNKQMTFDANGSLTSITDPDGVTTFTWDARNRLAALSGPSLSAAFAYDSLGRRSTRQVNGARTDFRYDGINPMQELSGTPAPTNMLTGLGVDEYFTRTDARGTHTLLTDALGSTLALMDSAGTVPSAYTYEPYGRITTTGTTTPNSFQYTGRENDGMGLYYYRARYYLPSTQRFISEDPLGFLGGDTNLYGYVLNNPVNFVDSSGLYTEIIVWQPVGWGSSSFGHVSVVINGVSYSFGPSGWTVESAANYIARQSFRNGTGVILNLSPSQEASLKQFLINSQWDYNSLWNNCGTAVQYGLSGLGLGVGNNVFPTSLRNSLLDSPLNIGTTFYPATQPRSIAPWAF